MIFQGTQTSIAKKPYIFLDFSGGGSKPPVPHSGSANVCDCCLSDSLPQCNMVILQYVIMVFPSDFNFLFVFNFMQLFNPYTPSLLYMGHRQITQTQVRSIRMRRVIRVSTFCSENVLFEWEHPTHKERKVHLA